MNFDSLAISCHCAEYTPMHFQLFVSPYPISDLQYIFKYAFNTDMK